MKRFFKCLKDNKVLIIGLLLAAALPINDLIQAGHTSTKVLVISALTGAISWGARNLRGQWQTIMGALLQPLATIAAQETGTPISWPQIIIQAFIAYGLSVSAPPKPKEYEKTPEILKAKAQAADLKNKNECSV